MLYRYQNLKNPFTVLAVCTLYITDRGDGQKIVIYSCTV